MFYSPTCYLSFQVTIEELSDKVLLKIFRYFLDASPRHWVRLVHICHKWRRIVFGAQRPLSLRLFCTYGTPVLKTLHCWPALPIVVEYGGSPALGPPTPEDEDNIVVALKRCERVHSITLTVTGSLLPTLEGSFSELEDLVLLSQYSVRMYLHSTFRWVHAFVVSTQLASHSPHSSSFFPLPAILWTFGFMMFLIFPSSRRKFLRRPCLGCPSFDHFHSISPLLPHAVSRHHHLRNISFSPLSPASIFEELLGICMVLWP